MSAGAAPSPWPAEIPLPGGRSNARVVRIGNTVRRVIGPHSAFVHALLLHLEAAGFEGAPRYLGIDAEGREILSYLEGHVPHGDVEWTEERLAAVARLLRALHDAAAGSALAGQAETVCHLDLAPWNVVLNEGRPVGFIDFDDAAPGRRVDDLAYAGWVFLDLGDPRIPARTQAARLVAFCHAYGPVDRAGLLPALAAQQERILQRRLGLKRDAPDPGMRADEAERVDRIRREQTWLREHHDELAAALGPPG